MISKYFSKVHFFTRIYMNFTYWTMRAGQPFCFYHGCILIGPNFKNLHVRNYNVDWIVTLQWLLDGLVISLWIICWSKWKLAAMTKLSLTLDRMGISHFWDHRTDFNQKIGRNDRWSFTRLVNLVPIWNATWPLGQLFVLIGPNFKNLLVTKLQIGLKWN